MTGGAATTSELRVAVFRHIEETASLTREINDADVWGQMRQEQRELLWGRLSSGVLRLSLHLVAIFP